MLRSPLWANRYLALMAAMFACLTKESIQKATAGQKLSVPTVFVENPFYF